MQVYEIPSSGIKSDRQLQLNPSEASIVERLLGMVAKDGERLPLIEGAWFLEAAPQEAYRSIAHSEITAYGVLLCTNLYKWTNDKRFLNAAVLSARFLKAMQNEEGAVSFGVKWPYGERSNKCYSFDTAIVIQAWLALHSLTSESEYLDTALKSGSWLCDKAQREDGSFRASCEGGRGWEDSSALQDTFWGDDSPIHAKNALALFRLSRISGISRFADSAKNLLKWVDHRWGKLGPLGLKDVRLNLSHVLSYLGEGWLSAYENDGSKLALERAKEIGVWLLESQDKNGALYWSYPGTQSGWIRRLQQGMNVGTLAVGPTAQAMRIWMILAHATKENRFYESTEKAYDFLCKSHRLLKSDSNRLPWGYYVTTISQRGPFMIPSKVISTWANGFALQASLALKQGPRKEDAAWHLRALN